MTEASTHSPRIESGAGKASAVVDLGRVPSSATAGVDLVLLPLGATEQHGPHLPLGTDSAIAGAVATEVAEQLADLGFMVGLAPAVPYGASGEHQSFAGTCSIGTEALVVVLVELARSLRTWVGRVVLVNGHGGNVEAIRRAVRQLRAEGHDISWVPCGLPGGDAHAGDTETSMLLHLDPGAVDRRRCEAGNVEPLRRLAEPMRRGGVAAVSRNGVLGDPRRAEAGRGQRILERVVENAVDLIATGQVAPDGRLVASPPPTSD